MQLSSGANGEHYVERAEVALIRDAGGEWRIAGPDELGFVFRLPLDYFLAGWPGWGSGLRLVDLLGEPAQLETRPNGFPVIVGSFGGDPQPLRPALAKVG